MTKEQGIAASKHRAKHLTVAGMSTPLKQVAVPSYKAQPQLQGDRIFDDEAAAGQAALDGMMAHQSSIGHRKEETFLQNPITNSVGLSLAADMYPVNNRRQSMRTAPVSPERSLEIERKTISVHSYSSEKFVRSRPLPQSANGSSTAIPAPVKRPRGRPKGSKTRPELLALRVRERAAAKATSEGQERSHISESSASVAQLRRSRRANATQINGLFRIKRQYIRRKPLEECLSGREQRVGAESTLACQRQRQPTAITLASTHEEAQCQDLNVLFQALPLAADHPLPKFPEVHSFSARRSTRTLTGLKQAKGEESHSGNSMCAPLERNSPNFHGPSINPQSKCTTSGLWLSTIALRSLDGGDWVAPLPSAQQDYSALMRMQWARRCGRTRPALARNNHSSQKHQETCPLKTKLDLRILWLRALKCHLRRGDDRLDNCSSHQRAQNAPLTLRRNLRRTEQCNFGN